MFHINYRDPRAIYEQIKDELKRLIISGILAEGEQIPSVREIAVTLAVNPNTIQRAYRELEADGYIYTVRGKGCFVASAAGRTDGRKVHELKQQLSAITKELLFLGVSRAELIRLLEEGENADDRSNQSDKEI